MESVESVKNGIHEQSILTPPTRRLRETHFWRRSTRCGWVKSTGRAASATDCDWKSQPLWEGVAFESRQSWSLDNAVKAEDVQDIFKLADWSGTRSSDIRSPSP